jgi:prepilin peptidase CpaA
MTSLDREFALSDEISARSLPVALCVASLVGLGLLWSGSERPLPALGWAVAFLFLVVEEDVRRLRIPNVLTMTGLLLALAYATWLGGVEGLVHGIGGALCVFAVFFIPFAMRWMGAGDVKAVMVLGALWGATIAIGLMFWALLLGGLLAIAIIVVKGGLPDVLRRWSQTLGLLITTRKLQYFAPRSGTAAAGGLPFGIAIGLGVAAYQLWGVPWA